MGNTQALLLRIYAAFNQRDVDGALALMTEDVDWPKASEGGRARGREAVRAYWTRQWEEFDPHVDPLQIVDRNDGRTEVTVHQLVRHVRGDLLSDSQVVHLFTITGGLIERMDLPAGDLSSDGDPSAAFSKR